MARQIVLFNVVTIILLTCISTSCGQTCNWTSHNASRSQLRHETTMLDGWIDLANKFVDAVAPKELTALDKIAQYTKGDGNLDFKDVIVDLLKMEAAFAACLFLGLIYFLTMGTGWSCFLCCRCCGNCGADKSQRQTKNISSRRSIYVVLTVAVLGLLTAAVTCAFLANEELYQVMTKGHGSVQKVIDKVEVYVNNTQKEIKTLDGCFEDTKEDIISSARDAGIEQGLANQLKDEIQDQSASIFISLKKLDDEFKEVKDLKGKVEFVKKKEARVGDLKKIIQDLRNNCSTSSPSDTECVEINQLEPAEFEEIASSSFSKLPDKVNQVFSLDFSKKFQDQINKLPKKIVKETNESRTDIIKEIESFKQNKELVEEIDKGVNDFHNETNKLNENFSKYITSQEVYRYWGVFGLIMFVALPSGLLFLGLCCGLLGSKSGRYPSERSGLSHCGGCTMMASVYLMFILGSFAMLFTAAFFQVGGHVEAYGCRYLYEKDLKTVDRILEIFLPNKSDSKLIQDLKSLKIGEIAKQCENDSAIYVAIPSLETMLNVKLTFDKEIDKIKFDGHEKEVNNMIMTALTQLIDDINDVKNSIDTNALHELLGRSKEKKIEADKAVTVQVLEKLVKQSLPVYEREKLSRAALEILRDLQEAAVKRDEITAALGSDGAKIAKYKTSVDKTMKDIQTEIENNKPKITGAVEKMVKQYCADMLLQLKEFASETIKTIKEEVGKCGTLYDAFALGRHFACREVMGPLNALWFSLGMCCFFFLFAIPFATKLSKHFYIMDEDEDFYIGMDSLHGQHINGYAEHQVPLHKGGNNGNNFPNKHSRPMHHQNGAYEPDVEERFTRY